MYGKYANYNVYDGCDDALISVLLLTRFKMLGEQLARYAQYRAKYMRTFGRMPKPHNNGMADVMDTRNLLAIPVTWC